MRLRRRLAALLVAAAAFITVTFATVEPAAAAGSYVRIRNEGSGLCLEVAVGDEDYNGAVVQQNRCTARRNPNQLWLRLQSPKANHWYLINQANSKCMDVRDGRDADNTPVQLWDCTGYDGMYWRFAVDTSSKVRSKIGERCLDVVGGSLEPGATLQTYHCTDGNTAQLFIVS